MASSQARQVESSPRLTSKQNGSPTKSLGSQSPSYDSSPPVIAESSRGGPSQTRHATAAVTYSAKGKEKQQRLSQVAPERPDNTKLKNEDEPWLAKNVLSFDGGGIRGLYSLFLLRQLMDNIRRIERSWSDGRGKTNAAPSSFHPLDEPFNVSHILRTAQDDRQAIQGYNGHYLPCHYFDYICGTSTGGLIAIMLSRLRMTVEDCIEEYESMASRVFGNPRHFHSTFIPTMWLNRPKYDAATLESVIGGVTRRRGEVSEGHDGTRFKTGSDMCRTFVFAYRKEGHDNENTGISIDLPYIFRSYDHFPRGTTPFDYPRNPGRVSEFPIWRVARATTAAPLYFAPMQVVIDGDTPQQRPPLLQRVWTLGREPNPPTENPRPVTFVDGGFGTANNPSREAFYEVTTSNESIGTFVSIGTGRGRVDRFHRGLKRLIHTAFQGMGDPEPAHISMKRESKNSEHGFSYFRLNEPSGLEDLDFDEWKPSKSGRRTRRKIEEAYRRWACDTNVAQELHDCALELVRRRRLRTADESKWERYAAKAYYDCREENCPQDTAKRWYSRNDFQSHLMVDHGMEEDEDLQKAIKSHRTVWSYKPRVNGGGV